MIKKFLFLLTLSTGMMMAGCGQKVQDPAQDVAQTESLEEAEVGEAVGENNDNQAAVQEPESNGATETDAIEGLLEGLSENEYEGLEISAAILPRMAILPGMTVPVTVVARNTGEQTIAYAQGSGSYETPEALILDGGGLQWIRPQDQLGAVTSDFMMKELKPGEEFKVTLFVRAMQENKDFDLYANEIFDRDQSYIGDLEWGDLKEAYPDLEAAAPGSYDGAVYLRYRIVTEEGLGLFGDNTGYAKASFTVAVNE